MRVERDATRLQLRAALMTDCTYPTQALSTRSPILHPTRCERDLSASPRDEVGIADEPVAIQVEGNHGIDQLGRVQRRVGGTK